MSLIDEAFEYVQNNEPSDTTFLVARLGCELEQSYAKNRMLHDQNQSLRRSYKKLKCWFTRQFKFYKAHRDELLDQIHNKVDGSVVQPQVKESQEESRVRHS